MTKMEHLRLVLWVTAPDVSAVDRLNGPSRGSEPLIFSLAAAVLQSSLRVVSCWFSAPPHVTFTANDLCGSSCLKRCSAALLKCCALGSNLEWWSGGQSLPREPGPVSPPRPETILRG